MATTPPSRGAGNGELIRWAFEDVLNGRDVAPLKRLWTDETVERFPQETCTGADAIAAYFEGVFAALPDFHMEIVCPPSRARTCSSTGSSPGPTPERRFGASRPPARGWRSTGSTTSSCATGGWCRTSSSTTKMQFAQQSGLMPPEGSSADRGLKAAFNAKTRLLEHVR